MNIHCTGDDVAAVQHCKLAIESPTLQSAAGQLNALNETAGVASSASASASTSPVAAAAAAVVSTGVSHPPGVQQIIVPHSSSVPSSTTAVQPHRYSSQVFRTEYANEQIAQQLEHARVNLAAQQAADAAANRPSKKTGNGGSSKHKKKHPRSTNKRKLLVKRIRRRSMKHKKKVNGN